MKKLLAALVLLLLVTPAWASQTVHRHLEPETVAYQTLSNAAQTQFATNTNIRAIKFGSGLPVGTVTLNVSSVAGTAFLSNSSVDLRFAAMTPGWKVNLNDGAKNAYAYAKAAGTGETLDAEINPDPGFDDPGGWEDGAAYIAGGVATFTGQTGWTFYRSFPALSPSLLVKAQISVVATGGSLGLRGTRFLLADLATTGTHTIYRSITTGADLNTGFYNTAFSGTADNLSVKQVLTPSATGLTLTSTANGAVFDFANIEAGWNPNVVQTVTITRN